MKFNRINQSRKSSARPMAWALMQLLRTKPSDKSEGFTLLESLVSMVIITITIIAVTPPIFWATATRVQNRRIEQAIQLAQSEIDRVRVVVERKNAQVNQLPPIAGAELAPAAGAPTTIIPAATKLRSVVPGCEVDDGTQSDNPSAVILVDTDPENDGSCQPEFMVQTFRGNAVGPTGTDPDAVDGFIMGVRVYSIVARDNLENGQAQAEPGKLGLTSGLGTQTTRPLTVQYSAIVRSNRSDGLTIYRDLCEAAGGTGAGCLDPAS